MEEILTKVNPNVAAVCITICICAWLFWMYKIDKN